MGEVTGSVTFVGSGPGEFGLLTVLGARTLKFADLIVTDADADPEELRKVGVGHAEIVPAALDEEQQLLEAVEQGQKVVRLGAADHFVEAGERAVLPEALEAAGVRVNIIPGLNHWSTLLTYAAVPVGQSFAALDACVEVPAAEAWPKGDTLAIRTCPKLANQVVDEAITLFGEDSEVLVVENVATTRQTSELMRWRDVKDLDCEKVYFVVGAGIDTRRREKPGWYESKPLFDWRILSPRTKDNLTPLAEEFAEYGASTETIPTMSIEPPRTEQAMERAIRGLVDGRYLWCVFTSPHAVSAIAERLAEYGLDSRALSGVSLAAVGRGTKEALKRLGIVADLVPEGSNTVDGLASEFPAFDDLMDPINGVLVPSADVSIDPLLEGLGTLGWEVEGVVAYRTVRAAPPPAEIRDDIKTGMFDAVVFTSATSVRNMIGIAGKPHAATVIAAIGEATAAACEQHGLRVDVIAESPNYSSIADGLARFADRRRQDQIAKGEPVKKPSERKRRRRRKPVAQGS